MATRDKKVDIFLKKFLPQQQITENFFDYLHKLIRDSNYWIYRTPGVFTPDINTQDLLSSSGNDTIDFFTPLIGTDGQQGNTLSLDPLYASGVPFENGLAAIYHTGLRFQMVPRETEVNVRTGKIKYTFLEEDIGEVADPTSVTDLGDGTLKIIVDSVCEAGVTHAGRTVRVWLKEAVSEAQAFDEAVVQWDGTNNFITTVHAIGQQLGAIDVTSTKYQVFCIGPTIRKNTDLRLDLNVIYTGAVTGSGTGTTPSAFNHADVQYFSVQQQLSQIAAITKAFIVGGGLVSWYLPTSTLTWNATIKYILPTKGYNFTIAPSNIVGLADGECLYITLDDVGGARTFTKVLIGNVPNNILNEVIVIRIGNDIYFKDGALELKGDAGSPTEGRISDITQDLLTFIGADSESDSDPAYSSTAIIAQGSPLPTAIGALDQAVQDILNDTAEEEDFTVITVGGESVFTATSLAWLAANTVKDITVYVDGRKQRQSLTGALDEDFRKNSTTEIEFSYLVPKDSVVTIRDERTGAAGGGGGADFENITVDPQPDVNGQRALGTVTKAWNSLYLKDQASSQVYRLEVVSGVLQVVPVP